LSDAHQLEALSVATWAKSSGMYSEMPTDYAWEIPSEIPSETVLAPQSEMPTELVWARVSE
jgi:hypothetical protein